MMLRMLVRGLFSVASLAIAVGEVGAAGGGCCCPFMAHMFQQMQQQRHVGYQQQMQQQHMMMHQQRMMMQRTAMMQHQMKTMQQHQMMHQHLNVSRTMMMQRRTQMQPTHPIALHRPTTPVQFHLHRTTGGGAARPGQPGRGLTVHHTSRPAGPSTHPLHQIHLQHSNSFHLVHHQSQQTRTAMQQRQHSTHRTQTAQMHKQHVHKQSAELHQQKMHRKPVVHEKTTAKVGVTMTCGNCHGCKSGPPPTLTQSAPPVNSGMPKLTLNPVKPMSTTPMIVMRPNYRPPVVTTNMSYPAIQTVRTGGNPRLLLVQAPGYRPGFLDILMRRPTEPTSFELAMERLKPTEKKPAISPKVNLDISGPPTLPEMTSMLPEKADLLVLGDLPKSTVKRVPADLIVAGSTALLRAPLLPPMPDFTPEAPTLPPLPDDGVTPAYSQQVMLHGRS